MSLQFETPSKRITCEFYLDALDSKGKPFFQDNLVEVTFNEENDGEVDEFGTRRNIKLFIESVHLNGQELGGSQKNLILALLGGEDAVFKEGKSC